MPNENPALRNIAKEFSVGPNILHKMLREVGVLKEGNEPTSFYIEHRYFIADWKQVETGAGKKWACLVRVRPKGRVLIEGFILNERTKENARC